jgi:hypothetical protein
MKEVKRKPSLYELDVRRLQKNGLKKCCNTCEFGVLGICSGSANHPKTGETLYGVSISETEKLYPDGCSDWELAFSIYQNSGI